MPKYAVAAKHPPPSCRSRQFSFLLQRHSFPVTATFLFCYSDFPFLLRRLSFPVTATAPSLKFGASQHPPPPPPPPPPPFTYHNINPSTHNLLLSLILLSFQQPEQEWLEDDSDTPYTTESGQKIHWSAKLPQQPQPALPPSTTPFSKSSLYETERSRSDYDVEAGRLSYERC